MSAPVRLYPNRIKWIFLGLASALMLAASVWVISDGQWFGYVGAAFFGLGFVVSLILLLPGSSFLELDHSGFLIRNLFRDSRMSWSDIEVFEVRRVGVRKMVTLKYSSRYRALPNARALAQAVTGVEGALPDTYGRSAEDLAQMLNEYVQIQNRLATGGAT